MSRPSRRNRLPRAFALALLLFGLVCQPVLGFVGGLHAVEHAAHAAHVDDHAVDHVADVGDEGEPDHALGEHGLLHQCSGGASSIPPAHPMWVLATVPATTLPIVEASQPVGAAQTLPFRPPIG